MKKILIIDDNEMFRCLLAEWLKEEGFDPIVAETALEGIRLAHSDHPDLILCDVDMPELTGIEVLKQLYDSESTCHIPFVFLTVKLDLEVDLMQQPGASGVFLKGVEINKLLQLLRTTLG